METTEQDQVKHMIDFSKKCEKCGNLMFKKKVSVTQDFGIKVKKNIFQCSTCRHWISVD